MKRSAAAPEGAIAIEFALTLPLFLILLFGAVELGLAMHTKGIITQASREGARYGVVYSLAPRSDAEVQTFVCNYLKNLGFSDITLDNIQVNGGGGASKTPMRVRVHYTYHFLVLPRLIEVLSGNLVLSAETVMFRE